MDMLINLVPQRFGAQPDEVFRNADFVVTAVDCAQAGPMLTLENSRGSLRVLPYSGMTIWDADFDGYSLKSAVVASRRPVAILIAALLSIHPGRMRMVHHQN